MKKLLLTSAICSLIFICNYKVYSQAETVLAAIDSAGVGTNVIDKEEEIRKEHELMLKIANQQSNKELSVAEKSKMILDKAYAEINSKPVTGIAAYNQPFKTKDAEKSWKEGYAYDSSNPEGYYQAQKKARNEEILKNILIGSVIIVAGIFFLKDYMNFKNRN